MDIEIKGSFNNKELETLTESLSSGEAKEIGWEIHVPYGSETLSYEVAAKKKAVRLRIVSRLSRRLRKLCL